MPGAGRPGMSGADGLRLTVQAAQAAQDVGLRLLSAALRRWLALSARPRPGGWRLRFSDHPGWREPLLRRFAGSPHRLSFGPLSAQVLAAHDLVIPLGLADVLAWQPWREALAATALPLPSAESALLCDDKLACWQALMRQGFAPWLPDVGPDLVPPVILKPRRGEFGRGCRLLTHPADLAAQAQALGDPGCLCQQAVPGAWQYSAHVLHVGGRIRQMLTVAHHFDTPWPIQGQQRARLSRLVPNRHAPVFEAMLVALGFEGLCCIDYKRHAGQPLLLEINPRFGGSLIDLFPLLLAHLDGKVIAQK